MKNSAFFLLALVMSLEAAASIPTRAETVTFKAELSGAAEVPANPGPAKGSITATFDTNSNVLHWTGSYSGLSGTPTAGHFHGPASAGKNAGVAIPMFAGNDTKTPFEGTATLTETQATELLGGLWYVNVHTAANKAGEVRGQLTR